MNLKLALLVFLLLFYPVYSQSTSCEEQLIAKGATVKILYASECGDAPVFKYQIEIKDQSECCNKQLVVFSKLKLEKDKCYTIAVQKSLGEKCVPAGSLEIIKAMEGMCSECVVATPTPSPSSPSGCPAPPQTTAPPTATPPPATTVKEQVKCIFTNSDSTQKCYAGDGKFYCSGTGACIAEVYGEKGTKLIWKSSCGGYAYTVVDGENEHAEFKCEQTQTPTPPPTTPSPTDLLLECIKKYQQEKGLSYDEAKKLCGTEQCIEKYQRDKNLTYEEAKNICAPQPTPTPTREPCADLKQTLATLEESLKNASKEDIETLEKKIELTKRAIADCEQPKTPAPTLLPGRQPYIEECIKEYQTDKNLTYEKAKEKCAPQPMLVYDRCTALKKKLVVLTEKLKGASPEEEKSLRSDIEIVQKELGMCLVEPPKPKIVEPGDECAQIEKTLLSLGEKWAIAEKKNDLKYLEEIKKEIEIYNQKFRKCEATPGIKNPCDEAPLLKDTLERMQEKRAYIEELVKKGEIVETELRNYDIEILYVKKRLEQMNFACQQGKPVEESPCARLGKLEVIHREISEKEKLEKIAEEIVALKEKCKKENLKAEKVESLADVEKVYETKLKVSVESAPKEIVTELKKIEEEKNRLIEDFARNASELELKGITMIKNVKIEGKSVSLDEIKVKVQIIKVDVKGKEIEIKPREGEVTITQGNTTVRGDVKLEYVNDTLVAAKSGKTINVLPSEVKDIVKGEIKEIKITDEEVPKYIAKSKEKGRFLGIVPLSVTKEYEINAESGKVIAEKKPWWSFVVL